MLKGTKHNQESLRKMRLAKLKNPVRFWLGKERIDMKGNQWNKGRHSWNKGIKMKIKSKKKLSNSVKNLWKDEKYRNRLLKSHKNRLKGKGNLHYNWQGGKSFESYSL